jgi:hypothetical protein
MDLATIEPALLAWAAALTGVPVAFCQWENAPRVQHRGQLVLLRWVSGVGRGSDGFTYEVDDDVTDDGPEMVAVSRGPRQLVVQVDVEVHDQRPGQTARALLERLRDRIYLPSSTDLLDAANVALGAPPGSILPLDYDIDGHFVSRCVLDVNLNAASVTRDTGRVYSVATVGLSAALSDPAGAALADSIQPGGTLP